MNFIIILLINYLFIEIIWNEISIAVISNFD